MVNDQKSLNNLLSLISDNGFSNDLILMGSWNEYFYNKIYSNYDTYMATLDIDLYCIDRNIEKQDKDLYSLLIENGFVCNHDYLTNKTTFLNSDFEIEFLHRNTRKMESTTKVEKLGVVAECLNGLEDAEKYTINYHDETYDYDVKILNPAYYCIHKIIINDKRKQDKKEKDSISINNIIKLILGNDSLKKEYKNIINSLSKKQISDYHKNIKLLKIEDLVTKI